MGAAGSRRPWRCHRIDPPPSYLAPAKTHRPVSTQVYYTSYAETQPSSGTSCRRIGSEREAEQAFQGVSISFTCGGFLINSFKEGKDRKIILAKLQGNSAV